MTNTVWKDIQNGVDTLSMRERGLLLVVLVVAMVAGWYRLVWTPLFRSLATVEQQLSRQEPERSMIADGMVLAQTEAQRIKPWVPPEQTAALVDHLLGLHSRLRLLRFTAKPARMLLHCAENGDQEVPGLLFRHELQLLLAGDYPGVLDYVYAVEKMLGMVQIDSFDLKVVHAPQVTILLQVHFLSARRSLFVD